MMGVQTGAVTKENCLRKLKIEPGYNWTSPLLGIYLKKTKITIWKDICTSMFTEALFTLAKIWKQPRFPLIDEWLNVIIYTTEYFTQL